MELYETMSALLKICLSYSLVNTVIADDIVYEQPEDKDGPVSRQELVELFRDHLTSGEQLFHRG